MACDICGQQPCAWIEGQCLNVPAHEHRRASIGHLCPACVTRITQRLSAILELYATLPFVLPAGSVPDDVAPHRHVKGDSAPAPMRLTVIALLDPRNQVGVKRADGTIDITGYLTTDIPDVAGVLNSWAQDLANHMQLQGASLDGTLLRSVQFLRAFEAQAAAAPWVDDYQAEIDWIWRSLRDAHGLTPPAPRAVGACPNGGNQQPCTGKLWPDRDQTGQIIEQVTCDRCGTSFGKSYLGWAGRLMGDTA